MEKKGKKRCKFKYFLLAPGSQYLEAEAGGCCV